MENPYVIFLLGTFIGALFGRTVIFFLMALGLIYILIFNPALVSIH